MDSSLRILIIDYFDKLLEIVEERTEELTSSITSSDETDSVLEKRELFIDEIKNIRTFNLDNLGFIEGDDLKYLTENEFEGDEVNDVIFKRFCFFVRNDDTDIFVSQLSHVDASFGYLVVLDRYLNQENIECYWEFLKFLNTKKTLNETNSFFQLKKDVSLILKYMT
jgi:hypothetical protein